MQIIIRFSVGAGCYAPRPTRQIQSLDPWPLRKRVRYWSRELAEMIIPACHNTPESSRQLQPSASYLSTSVHIRQPSSSWCFPGLTSQTTAPLCLLNKLYTHSCILLIQPHACECAWYTPNTIPMIIFGLSIKVSYGRHLIEWVEGKPLQTLMQRKNKHNHSNSHAQTIAQYTHSNEHWVMFIKLLGARVLSVGSFFFFPSHNASPYDRMYWGSWS